MRVIRLFYLLSICLVFSCNPEKIPVLVNTFNKTNTTTLKDIVFINDSVAYAAGGQGYISGIIVSTHDAGNTWQTDTSFIPGILSLSKWGDSMVVAVGYSGNLMINKRDQGWYGIRLQNWSEFKDIAFTPDQDMYIGIGSSFHAGQILHVTKDFNLDSIYDFDNEIKTISCISDKVMIAAGYGIIMKSTDNGNSWIRNKYNGDYYQKIVFPTPEIGYTIGFAGSIIKSTDGGDNWNSLKNSKNHSFGSEPFLDIAYKDENTLYICGESGALWKTQDGGNYWQQFDEFTEDHLTGISIVGNNIWLSSSSGKIYRVID